MKRVRAHTLVLVNWKGVFYERYSLDEDVTALEGDNGAGKTTVMIAAYVVLLPDMTRLRFTNVGETDATGGDKGVWGRLGDPNRPSYAVIVFDVGDERVVAGVHLERKGEPSVELTPFFIAGLPDDVRLQDALLLRSGDEDLIPELPDLRENVVRVGARLQICRTAKEYFSTLFEHGITPLRLVADEERTRFNDMLRTSMTGGISRALTSEFRSFLLKEETGLADTLVRMQGNLNACRRTRTEVDEAQALEREISGVYEAGHEMFSAALLATRERAQELRRRLDEAEATRANAMQERDAVARDLGEQTEERTRVTERLRSAKEQTEAAQQGHARVIGANRIAKRVAGLEDDLRGVMRELETAAAALKRKEGIKVGRAGERARAEDTYQRAAEGLGDLQRGLAELHRRADAHRMVTQRLADARAALERPQLASEEVQEHIETTRAALAANDAKRNELDALIGGAETHRVEHREAIGALAKILRRDVDSNDAHSEARAALRALSELEDLAARGDVLQDELGRARTSWQRQEAIRGRAADLCLPGEPLTSSREVHGAFRKTESEGRAMENQARDEDASVERIGREHDELREKEEALQARLAQWRELDTVAMRLEAALRTDVRSAKALEGVQALLDGQRADMQRRLEGVETARAEMIERVRNLEESGGDFHPDLLTARDLIGGELLASHFDSVAPTEAGQVQARLGPLSEAIVVDDPREAAAALAGRDRTLETIWLVREDSLPHLVELNDADEITIGSTDVIVEDHGIVRTTRVPSAPTLGKTARERLVADLRSRAETLGEQAIGLEHDASQIDLWRRDAMLLTREVAILELNDPTRELDNVAVQLKEVARQHKSHLDAAEESRRGATRLAQRAEKLQELLADAFLLDEPGLKTKVGDLEKTLRSATQAGMELARTSEARRVLGDRIDVLRRLPLSDVEVDSLRGEMENLGVQRERLFRAVDALSYVVANREAFVWYDADESLSAKLELVPALKAQCDRANDERRAATEAAEVADQSWEDARKVHRNIDDRRGALAASHDRTELELKEYGVEDPSDVAVELARAASEQLRSYYEELDRTERTLGTAIAKLGERLDMRENSLREAEEERTSVEKEWEPAQKLWERLRTSAETNGLLSHAITARLLTVGTGSVNLRSEARAWGKSLDERLSSAKGGAEILERVRSWLSGQEQTTGEDYLQAWVVVRDWLRRRVPAQVSEVADPLEALERLRRHLQVLGERLGDQERKLRGASEDVARGIDVHIRAAQRQVRSLNRELEGVRFGTIRGIQIRLTRDDRMENVLRALREGSAQELLFQPTMPVEDALEALFTRYGGRGPTLGQKLLDYREYLDLAVEIQRQTSTQWERVNPSRLSTGEAIGVGTALMMVVLTAWERAANLFRAKRSLGTLRLLFLDEANRLSQDNLQVLFELCAALDLQLLIAAPEVARAPGCTTYRLVRRETADGREEVIVSGRRTVVEA